MSKIEAVSKLTIKISKSDLSDYSDVLYRDLADPSINGINEHAALTDVHGLPALIATINSEFDDIWTELDTKLGAADVNLSGKADRAGDEFTGQVKITTTADHLQINGPTSTRRGIYAETAGLRRWEIAVASNEVEAGNNTGSNFSIARYDDAGNFIGVPFSIDRETGTVYIEELNVGAGGILYDPGIDVRAQPTEPTENLIVGTVWLRTTEEVVPE